MVLEQQGAGLHVSHAIHSSSCRSCCTFCAAPQLLLHLASALLLHLLL